MRNKKITILLIIEIVIALVIITPFLIASTYALPAKDDFCLFYSPYNQEYINPFVAPFIATMKCYMTHQGTYSGMFLFTLVSPFYRWGIVGIKITSFITVILYFVSIFFLCNELCRYFSKDSSLVTLWGLFDCIAFGMANFSSPNELFYWITGIFFYTIPYICGIFGLGLLLRFVRTRKSKWLFSSAILAFICCGGTLQICGYITFMYMAVFLYSSWVTKKIDFKLGGAFLLCLIFSLINTVAPGNFVRNTQYSDDGIHIGAAIINTAYVLIYELLRLLIHSYLLVIVILLMLIVIYSDIKLKDTKIHPIVVCLVTLSGLYISSFPVLLGYNTNTIPGIRIQFLLDSFISLFFIALSIYFAKWIKEKKVYPVKKIPLKKVVIVLLVVFAVWQVVWQGKASIRTCASFKAWSEFVNKDMQYCYDSWMSILNEIEESKEKDVIIVRKDAPEIFTIKSCGIRLDNPNWINSAICEYYEKDSLIFTKNE